MNHPSIRENAVAVVTGAALGIGFAITKRLLEEGMKVVLFDKDQEALNNAVASLKSQHDENQVLAIAGDVTSKDALQRLFLESCGFGDLSLIVNNAAIAQGAGPWDDSQQWRHIFDVNFWSTLAIQSLFVEHLLNTDTPAAIVNLGSKEGITTPPGNAAYSVSKAALKVLTEQLEHELRERTHGRVSAHLLIPGYTFTPMNFPGMTKDTQKPAAPWTADDVANRMVEGMKNNDFYIFCEDNEVTRDLDQKRMQWSADDMIKNRPALSRWHPEFREQFNAYIHFKSE